MGKWDRPGFKTVNLEISVLEYEGIAQISRDAGWPVDQTMLRLMRAGLTNLAEVTGMTTEMLAAEARRRR